MFGVQSEKQKLFFLEELFRKKSDKRQCGDTKNFLHLIFF